MQNDVAIREQERAKLRDSDAISSIILAAVPSNCSNDEIGTDPNSILADVETSLLV
jgi:hypothetical protein